MSVRQLLLLCTLCTLQPQIRGVFICQSAQWERYIPPIVDITEQEYTGYKCDGPVKDISLLLDRPVVTKTVRAALVYGDPVKATTGSGHGSVSSVLTPEEAASRLFSEGSLKSGFDTVTLMVEAVIPFSNGSVAGLEWRDPFYVFEDSGFRLFIRNPGFTNNRTRVSLGQHHVCPDGVCGPSLCRKMSTSPLTTEGLEMIAVRRKRGFFPSFLAIANSAWNGVQQSQIATLIAAGHKQADINDEARYSTALQSAFSNLRVFNTRSLLDARAFGSQVSDSFISKQVTKLSLTAEAERNSIRETIVSLYSYLRLKMMGVFSALQSVAHGLEQSDPYAALSAYEGRECPPYQARYNGELQVSPCDEPNVTKIILLNPLPAVQHYESEGRVYHEDGCELIPGELTVSDVSKVVSLSENSTHKMIRTGGTIRFVHKEKGRVEGVYSASAIQLPKNEIFSALELKDAHNDYLLNQSARLAGMNDELKDLYDKAGDLGMDLGSFGGLLSGLGLGSLLGPCCCLSSCFSGGCFMCCAKCAGLNNFLCIWVVILADRTLAKLVFLLSRCGGIIHKIWWALFSYEWLGE